jgi:hypothetical protein
MFINQATLLSIDEPSILEIENSNIYINERTCFNVISHFIKNSDIPKPNKVLLIADVISFIRTEELLFSTISLLKEFGWFKSELKYQNLIDRVRHEEIYSSEDIIKMIVLIHSSVLKYEVFVNYYAPVFGNSKPALELSIKDRSILTNIYSIENFIRRNTLTYIIDKHIETLGFEDQDIILHELIYSMTKIDYESNTSSLCKEITLLEKRVKLNKKHDKLKETQGQLNSNPYPRIFKNISSFRIFERMQEVIKNPLADYSFIYRKMLKDGLIFSTVGDSEFRLWLSNNYSIEIDKTKQLYRCTTPTKEGLYSTVKSIIKED